LFACRLAEILDETLRRADEALSRAETTGRDRAGVEPPPGG